MKLWQVIIVAVLCVVVGVAGWATQQAVNDLQGGNYGFSVGQGYNAFSLPLSYTNGRYVSFDVESADGYGLDVYLTNQTGLMSLREGRSFDFDPQYSRFNVTSYKADLELPESAEGSEIYQLVIVSNSTGLYVPVSMYEVQSSLPTDLNVVFQALSFIISISSTALFVLLIYSVSKYAGERSRPKDIGPFPTPAASWVDRHPRVWVVTAVLSFAFASTYGLFMLWTPSIDDAMFIITLAGLFTILGLLMAVVTSAIAHHRPEGVRLNQLGALALLGSGILGAVTAARQLFVMLDPAVGATLFLPFAVVTVVVTTLQFVGVMLAWRRGCWTAAFIISAAGLVTVVSFALLAMVFLWYSKDRFVPFSRNGRLE